MPATPLDRAARALALAAALCVAFMMLFTSLSVTLRYVTGWTGENDVDIMVLAFAASFFIALPAVTLRDEHVAVDLIDSLVGAGTRKCLRWFGLLLTVGFLGISFFEAIQPALDKLAFGERAMSLDINRFWFWLPLLVGLALAALGGVLLGIQWMLRGQPDGPAPHGDA
tara:strand:+ start:332 stop:838 length:507 start_codon:yes stop_codon:yes gene_type:complete